MPNVNIPETEEIKLVWTHQVKRRRQPLRKMMDMVVLGKRRRGRPRRRRIDNTREDMRKFEMTTDMTENKMVKLAHEDTEMVSKCEKTRHKKLACSVCNVPGGRF